MNLALANKRVLITGSSHGIGLAIAQGFLHEGAHVVLTSRNMHDLERLKKSLSRTYAPEHIDAFACDFTKPEQIKKLYDQIGQLDVLIANVGSGKSLSDPIPTKEHFDHIFDLNFNTAVYASREFYPLLKQSQGNIIFIASIAGIEAFGAPVDYSVAKAAVIAFSKNLARKVAAEGVRVNCVAPGNIFFEGGSWDEKIKQNAERVKQLIQATVPMNRFGRPEEIADMCLFLASERASFITGALFCVDGGQTVSI